MDDVASVQPYWAALPLPDRARYLRRGAQVILDHLEPLGTLIARETGRPRAEALSTELLTSVDALHRTARQGPRVLADRGVGLPLLTRPKRARLVSEPLGVLGVCGSAEEPWSLPLQEVAIALMSGNGVVLAPAGRTPLLGERIRWVFERAGVPEGVVATVQGDHELSEALERSSAARVLRGHATAAKGPMLVLGDARVDRAVAGALWGGFANAGQSPSGIARVYVVREVAESFVGGLVARARRLRAGDPLDPRTETGPLLESAHGLQDLVDDAVAQGAVLRCGGPGEGERLYRPAVLTGVSSPMRIAHEPPRGPVLAVTIVEDEEEGIDLASAHPWGVSASVWTLDRARGQRIARLLPAERVWVNDHMHWGSGRLRSRSAFHECVRVRLVGWEPSRTADPWWFPYDESLLRALDAASRIVYGRDADKGPALRRNLGPLARVARRVLVSRRPG